MKNSGGFTLVELIIVLAIVAIIGAILIPNFLNTTDRARLRSDIQSARVLQNALDLHNIEQTDQITSTGELIARLDERGYIDERRVTVQTPGAEFVLGADGVVRLNIAGVSNQNVTSTLFGQLSPQEREHVVGGQATTVD